MDCCRSCAISSCGGVFKNSFGVHLPVTVVLIIILGYFKGLMKRIQAVVLSCLFVRMREHGLMFKEGWISLHINIRVSVVLKALKLQNTLLGDSLEFPVLETLSEMKQQLCDSLSWEPLAQCSERDTRKCPWWCGQKVPVCASVLSLELYTAERLYFLPRAHPSPGGPCFLPSLEPDSYNHSSKGLTVWLRTGRAMLDIIHEVHEVTFWGVSCFFDFVFYVCWDCSCLFL